jgi:hypothetical protein
MTCQIKTASSFSRHCWAKHPRPARLAEQRRIVAKVDQLMALVDELEIQLAAATSIVSALFAESTNSH